MGEMMQSSGMIWGMSLVWVLVIVDLALGAAALAKYLFSSGERQR